MCAYDIEIYGQKALLVALIKQLIVCRLDGRFAAHMMALDEKAAFSRRFSKALCSAGLSVVSPTLVAREFNKRYGGKPVTTQGVRKWLAGESIPAQDKIRVLSDWLNVSAQWLRFGDGDAPLPANPHENLTAAPGEAAPPWGNGLPDGFARLSPRHKEMVQELVLALLKLEDGAGQ